MTKTREASHAGSWYPSSPSALTRQLDGFTSRVPESVRRQKRCRAIISPHAGYSYSGPTAAFGFNALDLDGIDRIFILGPSHHFYLRGCALTRCDTYATPLGDLCIDRSTTDALLKTGAFDQMSQSVDEDEHSIEMQLPFLKRVIDQHLGASAGAGQVEAPKIVPILIGATDHAAEKRFGKLLAPYLADRHTAVVISSDFAHWGARFGYQYYTTSRQAYHPPGLPPSPTADDAGDVDAAGDAATSGGAPIDGEVIKILSAKQLGSIKAKDAGAPQVHASIARVDKRGMCVISTGSHAGFGSYLRDTGNTVCGRHPIGVFLAACEHLDQTAAAAAAAEGDTQHAGAFEKCRWLDYTQSSAVTSATDSSVSYASGIFQRRE